MNINWFVWVRFFVIIDVIQKIGNNKNSPNSLNRMVTNHYHGENRLITQYFPSMMQRG